MLEVPKELQKVEMTFYKTGDGRPTCEAIVPENATPGVTQMKVDMGTHSLVITVPDQAKPGDRICIEKTETEEFRLSISRKSATPSTGRVRIVCLVPPGVSAGQKLEINAGEGKKIIVTVPPKAKTGDKFILAKTEDTDWTCTLVHDVLQERDIRQIEELVHLAPPRASPMDPDLAYERLRDAVRTGGGFVHDKMARGALAPLFIPGMVATAPIEAGEELVVIPARLFLSPETMKAAAPRLIDSVSKIQAIPIARHEEAAQSAFVAQLLLEADARAVAAASNSEKPPEDGYLPEAQQLDSEVRAVWEAYADGMLSEDFSYHPYRRAATDPKGLKEKLLPSPEVDFFIDMAGDIIAIHKCIMQFVPESLRGPRFDEVAMFFRGKLSILTRVFQTSHSSTLVPIADNFNHANADRACACWEWNANRQSLIVKTERRIEAGEEIFESYGPRSNTLLLRTYGFTQPPSIEPSWSFCMRPEMVRSIYDVFMPPDEGSKHQIIFDARSMEDSLVAAMNMVAANKQNSTEFVKLCCVRCREPYLTDPKLEIPRKALADARAADPTRSDWWNCLPAGQEALQDDEGIRIKMSEFLCLEANIEAANYTEGKLTDDQCFAMSKNFREIFKDGIEMISKIGKFSIQYVDPGS